MKEQTNILLDFELKHLAKVKGIVLSKLFNEVLKNIIYEEHDEVNQTLIKLKEEKKELEDTLRSKSIKLNHIQNKIISLEKQQKMENNKKLKEFGVFAKAARDQDILEGFGE